ncbi:YbaB/EbfC family nucleoid-associated protein [Nocardia fluminea]|uniref:YbaB/EbfC DNA-binding family protein n=1 Tax=Nocardia fluminea TaxID=134984 RepID=A0A2N3VGA9_9NOCA|nr:YbaB/EbfC family nucleoid-associated protein [Nocardia fluminea]PKV80661.1 YbaB/EbfC DNA-binding family protein [Nocardia fluminea]
MVGSDPSRAAEELARFAVDLEQKAQRLGELQGQMAMTSASASTAGGRVSVTVDSTGVPTAIGLGPSTRSMDPDALSAEILSCMRKAQVKLRSEVADVMRRVVGEDPAGASILDILAERFPDSESETASEHVPPQSRYATPPVDSGPVSQSKWEPPAPATLNRKPDRDQIFTPDEPDEDDEYFGKKSWLE